MTPTPVPTPHKCSLDDFLHDDWPTIQEQLLSWVSGFGTAMLGNLVYVMGFTVLYVLFVQDAWNDAQQKLFDVYATNKSILAVTFGIAQGLVLTPFLGSIAPAFAILAYVLLEKRFKNFFEKVTCYCQNHGNNYIINYNYYEFPQF